MSTTFIGVTFAKQKVTPSDDAIVRRAILPDGILYGCELSYSGSTLIMAAGQLMICGRQIRHPASQNWAVIDATSGFARLLLTIDLTKTATKESFEQVVDSIEYASSEDGFPDLEQTDINVSGSQYQVAACVVSLGAGGITGIVSQLGRSVVDGSGGLNFSVVGGTTQPADPAENTIWVNTDEPITSHALSATEPEAPEGGMVWITTGKESPAAFNALKKNCIMVYPLFAKQYVSGAWVNVDVKIYQDGWTDLLTEIVFFGDGAINAEVFGNTTVASGYNGYTISGSNIVFTQYVDVTTTQLFDVSAFNTIECVINNWDYMHVSMDLVDSSGNKKPLSYITSDQASGGLRTFDISGYSGEYYLRIYTGAGSSNSVSYSSIKFKV